MHGGERVELAAPAPGRAGGAARASRPPPPAGAPLRGSMRPRTPRRRGCADDAPRATRPTRGRRGAPRSSPTARARSRCEAPRSGRSAAATARSRSSERIERTSFSIVFAAGWSILLIAITSGISMIPAFSACTESPEPGMSTRRTVSAIPITSTSLWPAPTVSRRTSSFAGRVEQERRLEGRLGEPTEVPARSHRADEDVRVEKVVREPDPVAEQRAVGEGAGGVDGDHAHGALLGAHVTHERADERRLADTRRARDADDERRAGLRIELADELVRERVAVLDQRDRPCERAAVAAPHAGRELVERPVAARAHPTRDATKPPRPRSGLRDRQPAREQRNHPDGSYARFGRSQRSASSTWTPFRSA